MRSLLLKLNFQFLLIAIFGAPFCFTSSAQHEAMLSDISGYATCSESDNPVECLKSFLNSIEEEESFFENMDRSAKSYAKSEYLLQLGLAYVSIGESTQAMSQIRKSLLASELASALNKSNIVKIDNLKSIIQDQGAKLCQKLKTENIEEYRACDCGEFMNDYRIHLAWVERQKELSRAMTPYASLNSEYILRIIKEHVNHKPPIEEFTRQMAIDTCILQIDHFIKGDKLLKECFLVQSNYQHLHSEGLMRIANVMEFNTDDLDLSFELTIITYPGDTNRVYFDNGVYLIEYKSEVAAAVKER